MRSKNSWTNIKPIIRRMLPLLVAIFAAACGSDQDAADNDVSSGTVAASGPELREKVTVSGLSSGGYMAVQTHIALADQVSGAGVVAGGPYHCAEGSVATALGRCLSGENLDVSHFLSFTREASASGTIASTESLHDAKVWIFRGTKDAIVASTVAVAVADYYREFLPAGQVKIVDDVEAVHGWPTMDVGGECLVMGGDFINACGYDTAGNLLSHLYVNLTSPNSNSPTGELKSIDFSAYFASGSGLADTGYIFIPENCANANTSCRLHISFHGCRQGAEFINDRFARASGLNEWAAQNRIVVVYPQIESILMNPQGCWDWWGYTGEHYDLRFGKQIAGISKIIGAFAEGELLPE